MRITKIAILVMRITKIALLVAQAKLRFLWPKNDGSGSKRTWPLLRSVLGVKQT